MNSESNTQAYGSPASTEIHKSLVERVAELIFNDDTCGQMDAFRPLARQIIREVRQEDARRRAGYYRGKKVI